MRRLAIVPALAAAMTISACGSGIELEGPGFDKIGLGGNKHVEKQVPDRAPLLIPPNRTRLPDPASQVATARPESWPKDPEAAGSLEVIAALKKKAEYQEKGDWSKTAGIDEFEKLMDPMERTPGLFSKDKNLKKKYRDAGTFGN
jgi:hypothetical protein